VRLLVTGSAGMLGQAVTSAAARLGHDVVALARAELDVTDADHVTRIVSAAEPRAVINCAGFTDVDGAEGNEARALRVNGDGARHVAHAAAEAGARVVHVSTDYVFDGTKPLPYVESDEPNPASVYGRSKRAGERALDLDRHTVVRISLVCGAYGNNLVKTILRLLGGDAPLRFVTDQQTRPTIVSDFVPALQRIIDDRRTGIWHVTNQGTVSPFEFAQEVAKAAGHDPGRVEPTLTADLPPRPAPRPQNAVLESERLTNEERLPDFRESLPTLLGRLSDR
jgi:dTDP-4-dehydrorhamnose reductase